MNVALVVSYAILILSTIIFGSYCNLIQATGTSNITEESIINQSLGNVTGETDQSESTNPTEIGTPSSITIDWSQLPTIVGLSAIISGGVSAIINYFTTMKQSKKQREVSVIQDMLGLYSLVIYHLDKLYDSGQSAFGKSASPEEQISKEEELKEVLRTIDSSIQNKSYLLTYDTIAKWMSLKNKYNVKNVDSVTANKTWLSAKQLIIELRRGLVSEYNDKILAEFEKITGKKLQKIGDRRE